MGETEMSDFSRKLSIIVDWMPPANRMPGQAYQVRHDEN